MTPSPRPHRAVRRQLIGTPVAALAIIGLGSGLASAHIDPDPPTVPAGTSVTVGFGVEHGCDGSNTTKVAFQIPAGVTDAAGVDKPGWVVSTAGDVITFADGNLDASTPETFSLTFTAPTATGTIRFPIIQTCAVGELAWIEVAEAGAAEPEHPAPEVTVVEGPATTAVGGTPAPGETTVVTTAPSVTAPPAVVTSAESTTVETVPAVIAPATVAPATASSDSAGNVGLIVGLAAAAVVVIAGAVFIARRRSTGV